MTMRKLIVLGLLSLLACCGIALGALYAVLHSPSLLNRVAHAFGYELTAQTISLSPSLSGSISDLSIKSLRDDRLTLVAANVTAKNSLNRVLRGEVESLVLQNPKLTYRIGRSDKEKGGGLDLSFLGRLPNVRLLDIQNAEAHLTFEGEPRQIELTKFNLTVKNYSSRTGGSIAFQTNFAFTTGGEKAFAATGKVTGNLLLTGGYPKPYGKGSVQLVVESGKHTSDGQTVSLSGLTLATELVYDQRTETFAITTLRGHSRNFGAINGTAKAVMRGEMPWSANLSVASMNFAQVFAVLKPFLPEEYRTWTMQGEGAVETAMQGTYVNDRLSLDGNVALSFRQGGFSSPDSTRAAQGVSGKLVLKLQYAAPDQKLTFNIRSDQRDGEYLWGKYYTNLAGQTASLAADGTLYRGNDRFRLDGSLDFFQTGKYAFTASGEPDDWAIQVTVGEVSHPRIVQTLLQEALKEFSPALANLSATGTSSLETIIRHEGDATAIAGRFRMTGTTLDVPEMKFAIQDLAVDLPFDLVYPSSRKGTPSPPVPGFVRFQTLRKDPLSIDNLQIPLMIVQNRLEVPEPVVVPFFDGEIHLYGVQVDDLLFPARFRLGVRMSRVDLGGLTGRLTGTEYPGTISADFGVMRYENSRVASEGRAVIQVFGGEIEATNLFAENLASPSRRMGGDITFRNINLEEVTRKVAVGKMTGIIQGSLKNFVMEYGQPASFVLDLTSVKARGVDQWISMDAIQSISVLGTGSDSALNKGITQFFREYPYSRIGIRSVLNNDQFTIRGTIFEDGKEYLVRRGFLRGVDVVNQNPENIISFRDMQERIQRIYRTREPGSGGITVE